MLRPITPPRSLTHAEIDEFGAELARRLDGISLLQTDLVIQRVKHYLSQYSVTFTGDMPQEVRARLNYGLVS